MNKYLVDDVVAHIDNEDYKYPLFAGILYEIAYQYDYIKEEYNDFEDIDLTLADIEKVCDDIISSYYMNEGLVELIHSKLYDYVKGVK